MLNVWERIRSKDLILLMRLCGCEEKYITGKAADFECFRELLRIIAFADGHAQTCALAHGLSDLLGEEITFATLCHSDATVLWKRCNEALCESNFKWDFSDVKYNGMKCIDTKSHVLKNKTKVLDISSIDIANCDTLDTLCDYVENKSNLKGNIHICLSLSNDGFVRPDRYHAELELEHANNGEKCNKTLIFCQILFELIYKYKREKIHIHIDSGKDLSAARAFVEYLRIRKLSPRIYLILSHEYDISDLVSVCALGNSDLLITPELADDQCVSDRYLNTLAAVYPIGLL